MRSDGATKRRSGGGGTQRRLIARMVGVVAACLLTACQTPILHSHMSDEALEYEIETRFPPGAALHVIEEELHAGHVIVDVGWKWGDDTEYAGLIALLQQPPSEPGPPFRWVFDEIWLRFFFDADERLTHYRFTRTGVGM